ncbi:MAG: hypothetical protein AAB726_03755 [Patescibacteria group bacterium]
MGNTANRDREKQIDEAVRDHISKRAGGYHPSWGEEENIRGARHSLWVDLDNNRIPEELKGFSRGEIRWWFMKDTPSDAVGRLDLALQGMIDNDLL